VTAIAGFADTVKTLAGLSRGSLLIEDWDRGIQFRPGLGGHEAAALVSEAHDRYGAPVRFTFFNADEEVRWEGELGRRLTVMADALTPAGPADGDGRAETPGGGAAEAHRQAQYQVSERVIRLNTDTGRFPGMRSIAPRNAAAVQVFEREGESRPLYLKFGELRVEKVGGDSGNGARGGAQGGDGSGGA
jgi:hypothetical protein